MERNLLNLSEGNCEFSSKTVRRIEFCGYTDLHVTQNEEYNSVDTLTYMQHIVKSRIM